ncbi:hypothetical protein [Amycolatopsis orientalis]|uniref:hypothetical protein n=1 Tax=Amycolatopsis orientalis TaxID=31958 RepID=UPI00056CECA2|nr:hypothetical protein [Amycolatopsis orientalis]
MTGETVVSEHGVIHATREGDGGGLWLLIVDRSVLCEEGDPLFAPVASILESSCTSLVLVDERADGEFLFNRAVMTVYRSFGGCPGAAVAHRCHTSEGVDREVKEYDGGEREAAA